MIDRQNHPDYDVIISGAGPVGLFLASELALAQCSVLILERAADPHSPLKQIPFGLRGLSTPTIESLDRRGLLADLELHKRLKNPHKTGAPVTGPARQGGHFAGIPFLDGNVDPSRWCHRLPGSTATSLISEMAEMESVLCRRAEKLGVQIKRGVATTAFQQTADGVTVQAGDQIFQGRWLVGCDGGRSAVRKAGGFDFAGTEPEFTGYSVRIEIADPEKLKPGRTLTPAGMYFQSQPGFLVMVEFDGGAAHRADPPTLEQVQTTLRRISNTDVAITALHAATTWTDRARQVTHYRNGRIFLAGDAAHIHAPLGGQGLNLGLGDAMNLGWKLAATIQRRAPDGLLNSYQTERHPLGEQVLNWSRAQVAIMRPDPAARALNAVVRDLMNTRDGATYIAGRVWGVETRHALSAGHALVGYGVPNFEFEEGTTAGELLRDGTAMLIDFSGRPSLKSLAAGFGDQIRYVAGPAKHQLGLTAVLVRPDGIVAWACCGEPDEQSLAQSAARWFVAPPEESA